MFEYLMNVYFEVRKKSYMIKDNAFFLLIDEISQGLKQETKSQT